MATTRVNAQLSKKGGQQRPLDGNQGGKVAVGRWLTLPRKTSQDQGARTIRGKMMVLQRPWRK